MLSTNTPRADSRPNTTKTSTNASRQYHGQESSTQPERNKRYREPSKADQDDRLSSEVIARIARRQNWMMRQSASIHKAPIRERTGDEAHDRKGRFLRATTSSAAVTPPELRDEDSRLFQSRSPHSQDPSRSPARPTSDLMHRNNVSKVRQVPPNRTH